MDSEKLNTYIVEYQFAGATYSFDIKAESWRVAENMVKAIRASAVVAGKSTIRFNSSTPLWFVRLRMWLQGVSRG